MSEERQNGMADYRDLAAVLADADKHFTIDFQRAVLASLLRIEQALEQSLLTPEQRYMQRSLEQERLYEVAMASRKAQRDRRRLR